MTTFTAHAVEQVPAEPTARTEPSSATRRLLILGVISGTLAGGRIVTTIDPITHRVTRVRLATTPHA